MSKTVIILLLFITGCTANIVKVKPPLTPKITVNQADLETSSTEAHYISDHLSDFINGDYSRFEQTEIMAVAHDVFIVSTEVDEAKFIKETDTLVQDWKILLALDDQLQKEQII